MSAVRRERFLRGLAGTMTAFFAVAFLLTVLPFANLRGEIVFDTWGGLATSCAVYSDGAERCVTTIGVLVIALMAATASTITCGVIGLLRQRRGAFIGAATSALMVAGIWLLHDIANWQLFWPGWENVIPRVIINTVWFATTAFVFFALARRSDERDDTGQPPSALA